MAPCAPFVIVSSIETVVNGTNEGSLGSLDIRATRMEREKILCENKHFHRQSISDTPHARTICAHLKRRAAGVAASSFGLALGTRFTVACRPHPLDHFKLRYYPCSKSLHFSKC